VPACRRADRLDRRTALAGRSGRRRPPSPASSSPPGTALLDPWLAGLAAAAGAAWRVRFRPSQPARAWRDGSRGERATARRLHRLERHGYTVLHDLQVPGGQANLDHLAVGPAGVFVIDSKYYRGTLQLGVDGMLWHGGYPLAQQLATAV
jgi:hypothetical protein